MLMRNLLKSWWRGEDGQDLVEYAFLVAFVALILWAAFVAFEDAIADAYTGVDAQEQDLSSETPDPWAVPDP
jgi:Flp pilus assembly pilin Flp